MAIVPHSIAVLFVKLMRTGRLSTVDELKKETGWAWADEYGSVVLELLRTHLPSPLNINGMDKEVKEEMILATEVPPSKFAETVQTPTAASEPSTSARAPFKCGNCGASGHNGESSRFIQFRAVILVVRRCTQPCGRCGESGHLSESQTRLESSLFDVFRTRMSQTILKGQGERCADFKISFFQAIYDERSRFAA
jgi:hypothetical protein